MEFLILGPLEILDGDRAVPLGGARERAVLAALLLQAGHAVPADRLIDDLWGDEPPDTARNSLQVRIAKLRKVLGSDRIVTGASGYRVRVEPGELDADRFTQLLAAGDGKSLDDALLLWRGPPLADFTYDAWARPAIARLEELHISAIERRIERELELGHHAGLVGELEQLVDEHPLREGLRAQLMLALYRSGRQAEALETYRAGRTALVEELGIEPTPALQELERRILHHDPSLELAPEPITHEPAKAHRGSRRAVYAGIGLLCIIAAAVAIPLFALAQEDGTPTTEVEPNSVAVLDARTGRVVDDIPVGRSPSSIAVGDGAVWVLNGDDRTVSRIDLATSEVRTISVGGSPTDLAVGHGALWVVDGFAGKVYRVDGYSGVLERTIRLPRFFVGPYGNREVSIAWGRGAVWVGVSDDDLLRGAVWRIDPVRDQVTTILPQGGGDIAIGEGAVWVRGPRDFLRIETRSNGARRIDAPLPSIERGIAVAAGAGAVWVTTRGGGTLSKIGSFSEQTERTISVGHSPSGVAVGHGSVWVANAADGTVARIDPVTARIVKTIPLGGSPVGIAIARGKVWVTVT